MTICRECATDVSLAVECKKCGGAFCHQHQRPDAHDCPALADSPTVPGRKESNGVSRRELLIGFLGVGIGGVSVAYTQGNGTVSGFIDNSSDDILNTPDPNAMEQELDGGFDRLVWQPDGSAQIYFDEIHSIHGFFVMHASRSDPYSGLAQCGAPNGPGPVSVPIVKYARSSGIDYPTREFKLLAGRGIGAGRCETKYFAIAIETGVETYFTIPERFDISPTG